MQERIAVSERNGNLPAVVTAKFEYLNGLPEKDRKEELLRLSGMGVDKLTEEIGDPRKLSYKVLRVLLPEGTDDEDVAEVLRKKRENWLKGRCLLAFCPSVRGRRG